MATFDKDTQNAVPVTLRIVYDGGTTNWGTQRVLSINAFKNSGEMVNNKYAISDLDMVLADTDAELWGTLGHGTTAFNKSMVLDAYVGGTMGYSSGKLVLNGTVGASQIRLHTGKVSRIAKQGNRVRVTSQNNMRLLGDLKWIPPVLTGSAYINGYGSVLKTHGSYSFIDDSSGTVWPWLRKWSAYKWDEQRKFNIYGHPYNLSTINGSFVGTGLYETGNINDFLGIGYGFVNDLFYEQHPRSKLEGTYLGTYIGTFRKSGASFTDDQNETARALGFDSANDADSQKVGGTEYPIMKVRVKWPIEAPSDSYVLWEQLLKIEGDPANVFRHLVIGKFVSGLFGTSDFPDSTLFQESESIGAAESPSQTINPEDEEVLPYIKNFVDSTNSVFSLNSSNQFEYRLYGPKNLTASIPVIGTSDVLDSSLSNDIEDYHNRFVVKYAYNLDTDSFGSQSTQKSTGWTKDLDRPIEIEAKWVVNPNEARTIAIRMMDREKNTVPKIEFTTPLQHLDVAIGTLLKLTDGDSGISNKTVQVYEYTKDLENKTCKFSCYDGEALWSKRGYAFYEDEVNPTSGNETHTAIYETHVGTRNTDVFGSEFIYW